MDKSINLLLVGETGVGKSTFINAFANYLSYASFEEALAGDPFCLIPVRFYQTINDKDVLIKYGKEDMAQVDSSDQSSTQQCRSYIFSFGELSVNLIDTPGIGDPRGIEADHNNLEKINAFMKQYKEIHGICLFFKANVSKLTLGLTYSIFMLLSSLEKSVKSNIIFLFTNSRSSFYKAGNLEPIRSLLDKIKEKNPEFQLNFNKSNRFYVDSEAFRCLVAKKTGVQITEKELSICKGSWNNSAKVSLGVIHHLLSLQPHRTELTAALAEARRLIQAVSFPMVDFSKNLARNLVMLEEHQNKCNQVGVTELSLLPLRSIPIYEQKFVPYANQKYCCTSNKCQEISRVNDFDITSYPQVCSVPSGAKKAITSFLSSSAFTIIEGIATVASTFLFKGLGAAIVPGVKQGLMQVKDCSDCGCHPSYHQWIAGETIVQKKILNDFNISQRVQSLSIQKAEAQKIIKETEKNIQSLSVTSEKTLESAALFSCFLSQNSLFPSTPVFEKRLQDFISNQEQLNKEGLQNFKELKILKTQLEKFKVHYNNAEKSQISIEIIKKKIEDMKNLKGSFFAELLQNFAELESNVQGSSVVPPIYHERLPHPGINLPY